MNGILWLASYPKSGNTWLRLALQSLRRPQETVDLNDRRGRSLSASSRFLLDRTLNVESSDLTPEETEIARPQCYEQLAASIPGCVILKAHDAWTLTCAGTPMFPASATGGVVYLTRDPRDVAPSLAHHLGSSIDAAIEQMADPDHIMSASSELILRQLPERLLSWSAHAESWLDSSGLRLLLVRYEDMIADMPKVLTQVVQFAGLHADVTAIERAVESVRFSTLRAAEERQGFTEGPAGIQRFFRRGVVGGWRDELTPAQVERIVMCHGTMMRRLGYGAGQ